MGRQKYYSLLVFFITTLFAVKASMIFLIGRHLLNHTYPLANITLYSPEIIMALIGIILIKNQLYKTSIIAFNAVILYQLISLRYTDVFLANINFKEIIYAFQNAQELSVSAGFFFKKYYVALIAASFLFLNSAFIPLRITDKIAKIGQKLTEKTSTHALIAIICFIIILNLLIKTPYDLNQTPIGLAILDKMSEEQAEYNSTLFYQEFEDCLDINVTKPNIAIIVLESESYLSTSIYDKEYANVTPFMNALSKQSSIVGKAYVPIPHSSKTMFAINTGLYPVPETEILEVNLQTDTIAKTLKELNYHALFTYPSRSLFENQYGQAKNQGFDEVKDLPYFEKITPEMKAKNSWGYDEMVMLNQTPEPPFYTMYWTISTHEPFWYPGKTANTDNYQDYLKSISHVDRFLKELFNEYKRKELYDNTIFILIGDHGERFEGEDTRSRTNFLSEQTLAVPFILHSPLLKNMTISPAHITPMDIYPTILDIMNIKKQDKYSGKSLFCKERHEYSYASGRTTGITLGKIMKDKKYIYTSQDDTLRLNDEPINDAIMLEELHQYQSYGESIK